MTPTNHHIENLLEQCKSGSQHAQMEVYNRYYKAMYNASFRIVKDSFKAEDIMQESFLTAFTKLDTLKESSMFGPWLKRIVINKSIHDYEEICEILDINYANCRTMISRAKESLRKNLKTVAES